MDLEKKISRRNFIGIIMLSLIAFYLPIFYKSNHPQKNIPIDNKIKMKIYNFNSLRRENLRNNLPDEIKKDLISNRTLWIGRKLLTFAEIKF